MSSSYCPLAFREIYNDSRGVYRLCCHAKKTKYIMQQTLPFDFWRSEYMENIRQKMLSSEKIDECATCYELESINNWSHRNRAIELYGNRSDEEYSVSLKFRIVGSYCNLSCIMCNPTNSSSRKHEMEKIWGKNVDKIFKEQFDFTQSKIRNSRFDEVTKNIMDNIRHVSNLYFSGGEPLIMNNHWKFIADIPADVAKKITIEYDTNLTNIMYNNYSLEEHVVKKFKRAFFKVSCDHFGEKLALLRYPINVAQFEKNLRALSKMDCDYKIHATVTLLNIDSLKEIYDYYKKKFNIEVAFANVVLDPKFLSIRNLSNEMKAKYIKQFEDHNFCKSQMNLVISEMKKEPFDNWRSLLEHYLDKLFEHRQIDWKTHFKI